MAFLDKNGLIHTWAQIKAYITTTLTGYATTGHNHSYNDLTDKPTIPDAYTHPSSHPASMITGLSTVATTGKYSDLSGTPTIPTTVAQLSDASNYALKTDMTNVYKYQGSVATVDDLPTNAENGYVYDVQADGANYAWNGTAWDCLGGSFAVESITNAEIDAIIV